MAEKKILPDRKLHACLMCDLQAMLREKEFNQLKKIAEICEVISRNEAENVTTFYDLWDALERYDCIKVGDYTFLIEQLTAMKLKKCVKIISKYQDDIKKVQKSTTPSQTASASSEGLDERKVRLIVEEKVKELESKQPQTSTATSPSEDRIAKMIEEQVKDMTKVHLSQVSTPQTLSVEFEKRMAKLIKETVEKTVKEMHLPQRQSDTAPITKEGGEGKLKKTSATQGLVHASSQKMAAPAAAAAQTRIRDVRRYRLVFEKTYKADEGWFVQGIANLGNRFAVALESFYASQENRIDVFDFPDRFRLSITEHISGLYLMASTPDGKLAVLCKKREDQCCGVNTFDAETGDHVTFTPEFTPGVDPNTWFPLHVHPNLHVFAVNCRGEYYILGELRDVTVVRHDGSVVLTQCMEKWSHSISCGGKYVFIDHLEPDDHIAAYEVKENRLVPVTRSEAFKCVGYVSATPRDEVTVTCKRGDQWCLGSSAMRDGGFTPWQYQPITLEGEYVPRVSVREDYIVISRDNTIQVFAEEGN